MRSREWKHFHCEWLVLCLRWDSIHLQSTHRRCRRLAAGARTTWYFFIFRFSHNHRRHHHHFASTRFYTFFNWVHISELSSSLPSPMKGWCLELCENFLIEISFSINNRFSLPFVLSFFVESRRGRNSTRLIFWNNLVCPPVTLSFSLSLGRTFGLGRRSVSDTQSTFTITPSSSALCWGLGWGVDEMIVNSWVYHTQNLFCFFLLLPTFDCCWLWSFLELSSRVKRKGNENRWFSSIHSIKMNPQMDGEWDERSRKAERKCDE